MSEVGSIDEAETVLRELRCKQAFRSSEWFHSVPPSLAHENAP